MWTKQQQELDDSVDYSEASKTKTPFHFDDSFSWEEQAFAEDAAAGRLGGCVWPPRSYSCTFCRREFRSAQALGGHMNVHRRDRARLKQSPNLTNSSADDHHLCTLAYDLPNPKTHSAIPTIGVVSCGGRSGSRAEKDEKLGISCPRVRDRDCVGIGILDEGVNFGFGQPRPMSGLFDDGREEAGAVTGFKRRKTDEETLSSIQFCVKSSSLVERRRHHHHHIQSEVIGLSSSSLHDLDLELRLGGLSKG